MLLFLLLLFLLLLLVSLAVGLAAGVAAIIPLALAIALGGWLLWTFVSGRSTAEISREVHPAELLGPGGPDDPRNTANSET